MISIEHLSFSYGSKQILKDVNFQADQGKLVALIGPNGAGKSTLFKCILKFLKGYEGRVLLDGTDMKASFFISGATDASTFEMAEIVGPTPEMRQDMVRLNGKTADIRFRAEFKVWEIPLLVKINKHGLLTIEQVVNAINTAGFAVGIGEWRPGRGGQFGTFHVRTE